LMGSRAGERHRVGADQILPIPPRRCRRARYQYIQDAQFAFRGLGFDVGSIHGLLRAFA
jgi:hypothetical protein